MNEPITGRVVSASLGVIPDSGGCPECGCGCPSEERHGYTYLTIEVPRDLVVGVGWTAVIHEAVSS